MIYERQLQISIKFGTAMSTNTNLKAKNPLTLQYTYFEP